MFSQRVRDFLNRACTLDSLRAADDEANGRARAHVPERESVASRPTASAVRRSHAAHSWPRLITIRGFGWSDALNFARLFRRSP